VRYRPRRLATADVVMMSAVCAAPILLTVLSITGDASLVWVASPLRWPTLSALPVLALGALCAPLVRRPALAAPTSAGPSSATYPQEVMA
jgi:hypothetical protein